VRRHIDELAAEGIPPPERVPELYSGLPAQLAIGGSLPPGRGWSSGEVEYVLFVTDAGVLVGVGSDHTDRELERAAVVAAKQAFPKIVGPTVWPLDALAGDWDSLRLRSWVTCAGERSLYQEGAMATILAPSDLLDLVPPEERREGLVVFSGTVPAARRAPTADICRFQGEIVGADGTVIAACDYEYDASPASP
jgi:hypothetical protein